MNIAIKLLFIPIHICCAIIGFVLGFMIDFTSDCIKWCFRKATGKDKVVDQQPVYDYEQDTIYHNGKVYNSRSYDRKMARLEELAKENNILQSDSSTHEEKERIYKKYGYEYDPTID